MSKTNKVPQLYSSAAGDKSVYTLDKEDYTNLKGILDVLNEEGEIANPEEFNFDVTILEDGEPGVYAARLLRHHGWGLSTTIAGHKVWFEFCRSGRA